MGREGQQKSGEKEKGNKGENTHGKNSCSINGHFIKRRKPGVFMAGRVRLHPLLESAAVVNLAAGHVLPTERGYSELYVKE
jgi:hypothetical protein